MTRNVTKVGFILEVRAENENDLGNKLYGYCDYEAQCELVGLDIKDEPTHEQIRDEMAHQGYMMEDVYELQREQETVNDLIRNAEFEGHGVLFKTNGTNLSGDGPTEIPHFNHSVTCNNHEECKNTDEEKYYRLFSPADLILEGTASTEIMGDYKLREDVSITLSGIATNPVSGNEPAERVGVRGSKN